MITFQEVGSSSALINAIAFYRKNGWESDPLCWGYQINNRCQIVSGYFGGKVYTVETLMKKAYTTIERIMCVFLGMLVTVATLGLALCFPGVRNLFSAWKSVVCLATFSKESEQNKTINGLEKCLVTSFKVDEACIKGLCLEADCTVDHDPRHHCEIKLNDGKVYRRMLDDIEIRDNLEWLDPAIVKADYSHFAHVGKIDIKENLR